MVLERLQPKEQISTPGVRAMRLMVKTGVARTGGTFRLSSGIFSPMKMDMDYLRRDIAAHDEVCELMLDMCRNRGFNPDVIVSVPDGGNSFARTIARLWGKDYLPRLKGGPFRDVYTLRNCKALVFEDVLTSGGSTGETVGKIDAMGGKIEAVVCAYSYLIAKKVLGNPVVSLSDLEDLKVVFEETEEFRGWGRPLATWQKLAIEELKRRGILLGV